MKRALIWIGAAVVVLIAAAVVAAVVFGPEQLKRLAQSEIRDMTGRELRFEGPVTFDWNWNFRPRLVVEDLRLSNADWAEEPDMVRIGRIETVIDLGALLMFRVELHELNLNRTVINLRRAQDGRDNWTFPKDPATDAAVPEERTEVPVIGRLLVRDSVIAYVDDAADIDVEARMAEIRAEADRLGEDDYGLVDVSATGRYRGRAIEASGRIGSPLQLRDPSRPYPVNMQARAEGTTMTFDGVLHDPLALERIDGRFRIEGPDAEELFPLFGIATPATPPYTLAGRLSRAGKKVSVEELEGTIGDSDIAGTLSIDTGRDPPFLEGELVSERLDFFDIGPLVGVTPEEGDGGTDEGEAGGDNRVLPDAPLDVERLSAMDARLRYVARQIRVPNAPVDSLELDLELQDRVLRLSPLKVAIAGGSATADIRLDATRPEAAAATLDLRMRQLDLSRITSAAIDDDTAAGAITGRIRLDMTGNTIRTALGRSNGKMGLMLAGGRVSHLVVEAAGLDIAEALGVAATGDEPIPVRCGVAIATVSSGTATLDSLVLDTTDSTITATGSIGLGEETLDLSMLAHPKDVSLVAPRTPVTVGGRFAAPSIGIDPSGLAPRAGVAVGLSVLLTPLAGVLGFLDVGTGEDADCRALLERADEATEAAPTSDPGPDDTDTGAQPIPPPRPRTD